jgi:ribulose 1,5-bisphosphate synthetase/thiazole synthase
VVSKSRHGGWKGSMGFFEMMSTRNAKKILKNLKCPMRPERNLYDKVSWLHKRKVFRVVSYSGQVSIVLL